MERLLHSGDISRLVLWREICESLLMCLDRFDDSRGNVFTSGKSLALLVAVLLLLFS